MKISEVTQSLAFKFGIAAITLSVFMFMAMRISSLKTDLEKQTEKTATYKALSEQSNNYIKKYEQAKKQNDLLNQKIIDLSEAMDDTQACPVDANMRRFIDSL